MVDKTTDPLILSLFTGIKLLFSEGGREEEGRSGSKEACRERREEEKEEGAEGCSGDGVKKRGCPASRRGPETTENTTSRSCRGKVSSPIYHYLPHCTKLSHRVPHCTKLSHRVPHCTKLSHRVPHCTKLSHRVPVSLPPWPLGTNRRRQKRELASRENRERRQRGGGGRG